MKSAGDDKPTYTTQNKAVRSGILADFSNFEKCWPQVAGDVISCTALEYVGMDIHAKLDDSSSNGSRGVRGADFVELKNEHDIGRK